MNEEGNIVKGLANWEYIATERRDLRELWQDLIRQITARNLADADGRAAESWYAKLETAYQSSDRHYHNLEHLSQMLSWIAHSWNDTSKTCLIAQYAVFFHDAVYNSKASNNEEQSAKLAIEAAAALRVKPDIANPAADWILRTKGHDAGGSMACAHFLDCDLAILGAPQEMYRQYAAAIRREYAWVAEDAYRKGRAKVLANFLDRDRIYLIDQMAKKLEAQARWNLQKEMRRLEGGLV